MTALNRTHPPLLGPTDGQPTRDRQSPAIVRRSLDTADTSSSCPSIASTLPVSSPFCWRDLPSTHLRLADASTPPPTSIRLPNWLRFLPPAMLVSHHSPLEETS